jgi:hypothetical protein
MSAIFTLFVSRTVYDDCPTWRGECDAIVYGGNTAIAGEVYPICGNSRAEVIDRAIEILKSRGLHGNLIVRGD